jgi:hypothetical protein
MQKKNEQIIAERETTKRQQTHAFPKSMATARQPMQLQAAT